MVTYASARFPVLFSTVSPVRPLSCSDNADQRRQFVERQNSTCNEERSIMKNKIKMCLCVCVFFRVFRGPLVTALWPLFLLALFRNTPDTHASGSHPTRRPFIPGYLSTTCDILPDFLSGFLLSPSNSLALLSSFYRRHVSIHQLSRERHRLFSGASIRPAT